MARFVSRELPDDLYHRLQGTDLKSYTDKAILICTVDTNGWPHPAMLSYAEVVAKDRSNIRLATYKDSATTSNMRRDGKLTVLIIDRRVVYYIKGRVHELEETMLAAAHNSKFNLQVEQVLDDAADPGLEADMYVTGGITYNNPHWAAQQRKVKTVLAELLN